MLNGYIDLKREKWTNEIGIGEKEGREGENEVDARTQIIEITLQRSQGLWRQMCTRLGRFVE